VGTHECPAPTCTVQVPVTQLACRPHWYAIPGPLRSRLWAAYRGTSSEDHGAVLAECVAYLRDRFG
jgi:hypothetical protein